uniref:Chromo domain-containing protein n=1 Tax=Steinernema glaseri TaxID=37863 RepID=A0A1I8A858_9BILA
MVRSVGQSEYWARNNTRYHQERIGWITDENDDTAFPIDCILKHRITASGQLEYLVKWSGRPYTWAEWHPYQNIDPDLVNEYNSTHPFKIEKIVAERTTPDGTKQYQVKFKRMAVDPELNWYTAEQLSDCLDLIEAFKERQKKRRQSEQEASSESDTPVRKSLRKRNCRNN